MAPWPAAGDLVGHHTLGVPGADCWIDCWIIWDYTQWLDYSIFVPIIVLYQYVGSVYNIRSLIILLDCYWQHYGCFFSLGIIVIVQLLEIGDSKILAGIIGILGLIIIPVVGCSLPSTLGIIFHSPRRVKTRTIL